jgi:hypothetical protein
MISCMRMLKKLILVDLIDKLLDDHLDGEGQDGDGDKEGEQGKKGGKGRPKLSAEESKRSRTKLKKQY